MQNETGLVDRAQSCVVQLTELVSAFDVTPPASSTALPLRVPPPPTPNDTSVENAMKIARELVDELGAAIERMEEPGQMEELLELHDQILALLSELSKTPRGTTPTKDRKLHGLGITLDGGEGGRSGLKVMVNGMGVLGKDEEEEELTTPRMDKGKGRAEPEPEEHEKVVLSPTLILSSSTGTLEGSEDEDEDEDEEVLSFVPEGVKDVESAMDR